MTNEIPLPGLAQEIGHKDSPGRPWRELSESGLLWLINATVFHPRGFAFACSMDVRTGEVTGWDLLGDGSEPWSYAGSVDDRFAAAEETLAAYRHAADPSRLFDDEGNLIDGVAEGASWQGGTAGFAFTVYPYDADETAAGRAPGALPADGDDAQAGTTAPPPAPDPAVTGPAGSGVTPTTDGGTT
jgi:hypothetical protein